MKDVFGSVSFVASDNPSLFTFNNTNDNGVCPITRSTHINTK
jgi:hypothetical protein